jgi:2-phospho-L-lactate/phosphoenolpyruvate guanylyltransferase
MVGPLDSGGLVRTLAVVPIKSLANAKQRLSKALAGGTRRSLVQTMFSDVLAALRRAEGVEAVVVITDDVIAESLARGHGIVVLPDGREVGQSHATQIGIDYARENGFERVLLVPGDTPLLDPVELEGLLTRCERDEIDVAIVPDRHGTGTNALLIAPPDAFAPSFGPDSLERHVGNAREAGLVHRVEHVESLALDVDTPADLAALWAVVDDQRRGAQRTRGTLYQLDRTGVRAELFGASSTQTVEA